MKSEIPLCSSRLPKTEHGFVGSNIPEAFPHHALDKFGIIQEGPQVGFLFFPVFAHFSKAVFGFGMALRKCFVLAPRLGPDEPEPNHDPHQKKKEEETKKS